MKIDRRHFLSLGIGAAAGTALTPLPWKLTDDISIWTQNWPWVPVPREGKVTHTDTTCTLCPGGCGIVVRKVGGRAVKIEGKAGHPVNDGGVCMLGLSSLQLLYGPGRIKTPLKRVGRRGAGKWEKISWSAAMRDVAAQLGNLREKGLAHTVAAIMHTDRGTVPQLMQRFLTAYGSPNFFRMPSVADAYEQTLFLMQGAQAMAGFDLAHTDFVLSFGSGLVEGWGAPVHLFKTRSRWQTRGVPVVQIEPRLSNTAAKSDQWVPVRPGSEAALALGIAHVLIREKRISSFVTDAAFGFESPADAGLACRGFKQLILQSYGPDTVADITGVDAERIVSLARAFADAKYPVALAGRGMGTTPGSMYDMMAVHALNALVGAVNRKGGVWAVPEPDYIHWPVPEMDAAAAAGMQKGRLDRAGGRQSPGTRFLINRFAETVLEGEATPVQALLVSGANPAYSLPGVPAFEKALEKIPFVVSFSSYMDETTLQADLILPNHMFLERYEDVPAPAGFARPLIGLVRPAVAPLYDTRHVGDVLIALAGALGGSVGKAFPWGDYQTCLRATLGSKWGRLRQDGFWWNPSFVPPAEGFDTPSGKFEFCVTALKETGSPPEALLPQYLPVVPEGDAGSYPLLLMPYDSMRLAGGYTGSPPFMIKTVPDTVLEQDVGGVEIHPETAAGIGITEGGRALLKTPRGEVRVRAHLSHRVPPGVVAMPRGLGHTAYDDYLAGKGANVNALMAPVEDVVSGQDAAWGIRAKLTVV